MGCFDTQPPTFLPGDRTKQDKDRFFGRLVSRNESQTTKYKRIYGRLT